jgi:hypothetical protein
MILAELSADAKLWLYLGLGVFVIFMWCLALYFRDRDG